MAFPSVASSSSNTASSTSSVATTFPTGVTAGDLLILLIASISASALGGFTGWTKLNTNTTSSGKFDSAYRTFQAGDTAPTITGTFSTYAWLMLRITGTDPAVTPPGIGTFGTSASGQPDPPAYTPTYGQKDTLWIAAASATGNAIPTAAPTNYTGLVQASALAGPTVGTGTRQLNAASEDPGAFTGFSGTWYSATLAVPPVSSAGNPVDLLRGATQAVLHASTV